uniref:fibronectin type III domain-containing protein n=1 Tax=Demequina sp. TaxID=2050685 RepID=UPI0025C7414F
VTAGALPTGVTLDSSSGALGGAATSTGSFSFEVTATNTYGGASATFTGDIESIPTIATSALGTLRWSTPYDAMLSASAVPTETWSVTGGSLPAGLTLEASGRLHGTPTTVAAYSVDITATNTHGADTVTYAGNVVPIPATAPAIGTVTADNGALTLQFTPPATSGGSPVTGYEYTVNGGGTWLSGPVGVTTSPITIAGLANGTPYSVSLRAVTAAGGGSASNSATGTPRTVPDAPTALSAVPGERQVTVSFLAPPFDGGRVVDKYRVTSTPGGVQTECSSPCTLTGLTVGQTYTFTVQAHNEAGWSAASSEASATPGQSPGVPTGVPTLMILGASPSATVTAAGYPTPTFAVTAGVLPTGVTLDSTTGVLAGMPTTTGVYVFEVTATNLHGTASMTVMGSVESVPTISTTSLGTLQWSVAYDTTLAASAVPTATWSVTDGALPAGLTLEVDGQVHGTPTTVGAYAVEITATNAHGTDVATYSGTVDAIPATAPVVTAVTPDDASLVLEFTAPGSTGGAVVTGYQYSLDVGTSWLAGPFGVASSPLTITGLVNGTTYSVVLRAVTSAGPGAASGAADGTPRTIASAPTVDSVTAGDHSIVVAFTPPADDGGSAIVGYRYSVDGGSTWSSSIVATTTSPLTVFGLENGQAYSVALRAVSAAGDGVASSATWGTPVSAPVAMPGQSAPPELDPGVGDGSLDGQRVTVTSGAAGAGWKVSTPSVSLTLEAYDSSARLVTGGGGEAYFEGYVGGYVLVSGEGFKPGSTVEVWIFSTPMKLGALTVASDGTFSGMVKLPASLGVGAHTVQVNGVTAGGHTASTSLGVRLGAEPSGLAVTGGTVGGALAAQLLFAGMALVIVGRRRREV